MLSNNRTELQTPEFGTVYVRVTSMGLGMRLARAMDELPDGEWTPFHPTLEPIYRAIIAKCTEDKDGAKLFADDKLELLDDLSFDSSMAIVKAARTPIPTDADAKKNS